MDNDELVSQFMAVTGSNDASTASTYLEMGGNNLEMAVGLYMEHNAGGGDGPSSMGGGVDAGTGAGVPFDGPDVRAPDQTQRMRLMDFDGGSGGAMGGMLGQFAQVDPAIRMMQEMMEEQLQRSAFGPDEDDFAVAQAAASQPGRARSTIRERINAASESKMDEDDEDEYHYDDDEDEDDAMDEGDAPAPAAPPRLSDMFAPPTYLIHKAGGFQGARQMAKDSKRWLLVNIQKDSEFSSHALNRDVWRNDLVENLIREGFIFWQEMDISVEGTQYVQRYHVNDFPHIAIIDPRTGRSLWSKEGWTQQNAVTAETFAEMAMDFCSRNSFDRPPQAPKPPGAKGSSQPQQRPIHELSEDEQLKAAMRASMQENNAATASTAKVVADGNDDEVQFLGTTNSLEQQTSTDSKPASETVVEAPKEVPEPKKDSFMDDLLAMSVSEPPASGARLQLKMPDGKRVVRKFANESVVKMIYGFVAQSNEEMRGGREFVLMEGFPPTDLLPKIDATIEECKLNGQAITVRWKD